MSKFWKFIRNQATEGRPESIELRIEGEIVSDSEAWIYDWFDEPATSPNAFKEELKEFKGMDITLWIDSYGGNVFAAASIYNALKEHDGKVIVKVVTAISAASTIAMAGDEIHMSPVGVMMIHNPLTGTYGDMRDLRKVADILDQVKESIINAYVAKTGRTKEDIAAMMDDETWMSAQVAVKERFADKVLYQDEPLDVQNIRDLSFNRMAIVNSATKSIQQAINLFQKPDIEAEKEKLSLELDLL